MPPLLLLLLPVVAELVAALTSGVPKAGKSELKGLISRQLEPVALLGSSLAAPSAAAAAGGDCESGSDTGTVGT
jgi:hypothetical protein